MRLALLPLASALAIAACDGPERDKALCDCEPDERCYSGRCIAVPPPPPGNYEEPVAGRASCAAPVQRFGGVTGPAEAPPAGACATPVVPSALPTDWVVLHQASVPVGTTLSFDVPQGASGVTVVLQAASAVATIPVRFGTTRSLLDNTAVPLEVRDPSGALWFDDRNPMPDDATGALVFFGSSSPIAGTLTIPNTSRALELAGTAGLPAGRWSIVVSDYAYECAATPEAATFCGAGAGLDPPPDLDAYRAGLYDVAVVVRPGAIPSTGRMDVAFFLHGCPGGTYQTDGTTCAVAPLRGETAASDASLQRFLATFADTMAGAGVCVENVTWYDLPPWAQQRWSAGLDIDGDTACEASMGQLLRLSQAGSWTMNLFLMPTILTGDPGDTNGPTVVGIDGTIPGPSGFSGTVQSGAVVSAENLRDGAASCSGGVTLRCGADVSAYIAAHEAGHFLGLYHTTEADGASFDPLNDTPTCNCSCRTDGSLGNCATRGITGSECTQPVETCSGGRNLMFWLLDAPSAGILSPEQSAVIRANPLVR